MRPESFDKLRTAPVEGRGPRRSTSSATFLRLRAALHQYSLDLTGWSHDSIVGRHDSSPTDGQLRLITKVARMYHERGVRQVDIADMLHISQARVSRLLKRAAELGIVRTVVAVAPGVLTEVEEALEDKYGLAEAVVVDVEGSDHDIIAALGSAGATYWRRS